MCDFNPPTSGSKPALPAVGLASWVCIISSALNWGLESSAEKH